MAQDNIEIEIKTKISKKLFEKIKRVLKKDCKFIRSSHHVDDYYLPKHKNFLKPKYPYEWLTVRLRDDKSLLNYKCWYPKGVKHTTHCDEYETEIADQNQLEKIMKALEFKKILTIDKERLTYQYKRKLEVALDKVKGLGYFIEVEALRHRQGIAKTHQELSDFLERLGIKNIKTVPGGYGGALMRKKGIFKNS